MATSLTTPVESCLESKASALGFWLTFPSTAVARTLLRASSSGGKPQFSWLLIDAEHGLITDREYYELTTAIAAEGASPIIRVPWGEEWMIKRALDAGAHGIVTPMCHSATDAEKIVKFSKYPPRGTRGFGPLFTPHSFPANVSTEQYVKASEKDLTVIVQIETAQGLENVEAIARVDGIDVLFIGPFDLAMQTGIERGSDQHEAAMERILKAAHTAGKRAAIFCTSGTDARTRLQQGFDMVSINTDLSVLAGAVASELKIAQGSSDANDGPSRGGY